MFSPILLSLCFLSSLFAFSLSAWLPDFLQPLTFRCYSEVCTTLSQQLKKEKNWYANGLAAHEGTSALVRR